MDVRIEKISAVMGEDDEDRVVGLFVDCADGETARIVFGRLVDALKAGEVRFGDLEFTPDLFEATQ